MISVNCEPLYQTRDNHGHVPIQKPIRNVLLHVLSAIAEGVVDCVGTNLVPKYLTEVCVGVDRIADAAQNIIYMQHIQAITTVPYIVHDAKRRL